MGGQPLALAALLLLALPAGAAGHDAHVSAVAAQDTSDPCEPDPYYQSDPDPTLDPDRVIRGRFRSEREGGYVLIPFRVPADQTALRVRYCYDEPENAPPGSPEQHTLDLGLYEPRSDRSGPWGVPEFRGWGGSSHRDVTLSREGYSSEQEYEDQERVPGRTTRAFRPGPIPEGRWAVELGLASIVSREGGDADGRVGWRVEIEWSDEQLDEGYQPAPYDEAPARRKPGWYAGDLHVHAEHSALGDATMTEAFDYAFGSLEDGKAGLDFVTLSDYVSGASWTEVGRHQADHPRNLIVRSAEVITYRGHANSHANTALVDYRHGPLYVRRGDGSLREVRGPRPASRMFDRVHRAGGFTQINHPTIFPSEVPTFESFCRGCPWDYTDAETDYSKVDAIEIATGPAGLDEPPGEPGPNPFTVTAIEFWEEALAAGHKIAAVGSSDSHHAGRTPNPITQAPIGQATTVVRAPRLSERGVKRGVEAGHTYVKVYGNDGPDLRLRGVAGNDAPEGGVAAAGAGQHAIMGDTLRGRDATFTARVLGGAPGSIESRPDPMELIVMKDGRPFLAAPITSDDFRLSFRSAGPGRYRLQVQRGTAIEAVSSPIYLEPARRQGGGADRERDGGVDRERPEGGRLPAGRRAGGEGRGTGPGGEPGRALSGSAGAAGRADRDRLPFTGLGLTGLAALGAVLGAAGLGARRGRPRS